MWPYAALVVVAVAAAAILVGKPFGGSSPTAASISLEGTTITVRPHVHPVLPASALKYASPDSETVSISPSGPLTKAAIVKLPLIKPPRPGQVVVVLTSESPNGPWQYLPGTVIDGGRYVESTVHHLSFLSTMLVYVPTVISALKAAFNVVTDNALSNASQPSCANNSAAQQAGYGVQISNKGNVVLGCLDLENGQPVLKLVNNRRYPLIVAHSSSLSVVSGSSSGDVFQESASLLNRGDALIYPEGEVDFGATLQPGQSGTVAGDASPAANAMYDLSASIDALEVLITKGGFADNPSATMEAVNEALTVDSCRAGVMSGDPPSVLGGCVNSDVIGLLFGGVWGTIFGLVEDVSSFVGWVRSVLNLFVTSIDGSDTFEVKVVSTASASCSVQALASAAHAYVVSQGQNGRTNEINAYACDQGYAEILFTAYGDGLPFQAAMAFEAVSGGWQWIGGGDYIPPGSFGMPVSVGQALVTVLQANSGGDENVTF